MFFYVNYCFRDWLTNLFSILAWFLIPHHKSLFTMIDASYYFTKFGRIVIFNEIGGSGARSNSLLSVARAAAITLNQRFSHHLYLQLSQHLRRTSSPFQSLPLQQNRSQYTTSLTTPQTQKIQIGRILRRVSRK